MATPLKKGIKKNSNLNAIQFNAINIAPQINAI
jgi:hypothetical protein